MALVDVLDHFPQEHARRQELIAILDTTASAIVKVQDEATGLWYQILDLPEREGNYLEASASTMFVYAFAKAVRKGYLAQDYLLMAWRGYHGLLQNLIKVDSQGLLTLENVCGGAGLAVSHIAMARSSITSPKRSSPTTPRVWAIHPCRARNGARRG